MEDSNGEIDEPMVPCPLKFERNVGKVAASKEVAREWRLLKQRA